MSPQLIRLLSLSLDPSKCRCPCRRLHLRPPLVPSPKARRTGTPVIMTVAAVQTETEIGHKSSPKCTTRRGDCSSAVPRASRHRVTFSLGLALPHRRQLIAEKERAQPSWPWKKDGRFSWLGRSGSRFANTLFRGALPDRTHGVYHD